MRARKLFTGALASVTAMAIAVAVVAAPVTNAARALPASPRYVALGDSVAAGAGLPQGADAGQCGRSAEAYPTIIAASLRTSVTNLACSGAKVSDGVVNAQQVGGSSVPGQLDRAFANGRPDLITITVGANDVRWVDFIGKCYVGTCGTLGDTLASAGYLTYLQGKLAYTLHEIRERSGNNPPLVLISGYYNPISDTSCTGSAITSRELTWIDNETLNLNKAINQTVTAANKLTAYTFVSYVPLTFTGHGLCSGDPWVQGPRDSAPLHPTATGQAAIARSFLRYAR